ncbi:DNA repair protein O [Agrilactobacillus composti DSM 18527 = JCM 14202]|uniref:DNA repair protein RecO n=1 Tax=Agrilactobacillus composti DSM 18527 = JCM 14202 TaxID=1423734 RepID=X0PTV5_9LACO|nr:DNA repair protein RecO [Agrilactobacillus composti]KRM33452.1 DNA repair protein O [Agrilactobacillus composti DSM 18527 = JCM 14202]GAF40791.1 DNA recombination and repair protein RecO [Agrilactobacillus composti DSM 18527 = JCM 14202]
MATQSIEEFNGLILFRRDYREKDLLVKIITDRFGKKMFLIRGGKKPKNRLAPAILPFTYGTYIGDIRDGLSFIRTAKDTQHFWNISQDIGLNAYASYILGLVDKAFSDGELLGEWYPKVTKALQLIDEGFDAQIITQIMQVQLLRVFGVQPGLESCVVCQRTDRPFDYSEAYGGLLCDIHWHLDPNRFHASQRAIYFLRLFSAVDLYKINSIKMKTTTKNELKQMIDTIYDDTVGIYLKSKKFLDDMANWPTNILKTPPEDSSKT